MTVTIILLAIVAAEPASARRQKSEESWDNLKKLRVGEEIQVVYGEEQYLNGRFLAVTRDAISVQWGTVRRHEETIARADVIRVIASRPSAQVKNVLLGVAAGAAIGGSMGAAAANSNDYEPIRKEDVKYAGIGAAIGAVLGGVAGALSSPDATIYQSPRETARQELRRRHSAESARDEDGDWDNLRTLRILQEIRVVDQERRVYNGRFYSVSYEAISFDGGESEVTIERADVLEVSIERLPQKENFAVWVGLERMTEWETIYSK